MGQQVNVYRQLKMYRDAIVDAFPLKGTYQDIFTESATQNYDIGARRQLSDGRVYHYSYANSALLCGMGAHDGGTVGLYTLAVSSGQAAGAAYLTIPDTTSSHTADYWKNGYVALEGYGPWTRRILSSTASDSSTVNLTLETTLPAAVTTNKVQVVRNPYATCTKGSVLGANTAKITSIVCVPPIAVTSTYYFWGQTWGAVGGCPVAFFGDLEFERAVGLFDTDGAVMSRFAYTEKYQDGGHLIGRYTASTDHRIPIYMLMLDP